MRRPQVYTVLDSRRVDRQISMAMLDISPGREQPVALGTQEYACRVSGRGMRCPSLSQSRISSGPTVTAIARRVRARLFIEGGHNVQPRYLRAYAHLRSP